MHQRLRQGDFKHAAAHYEDALAILEKQSQFDPAEYETVARNYADLLRAIGKERKAVAVEERITTLEASGGVRLDTVKEIASTGVHSVSAGAITHSAPAVDLSLEIEVG